MDLGYREIVKVVEICLAQFINLLSFLTKEQVSLLDGWDVTRMAGRRNVNNI